MKKIGLLHLCALIPVCLTAQNWYEVPTGTNKRLNTIDFASANVGYIGGNDSLLLKTTDGGQTWNPVNYSGVTFYPGGEHIVKLQFVNETTGFMAVGPYSGSYKTTDGGQTWTALSLSSNLCYNEGLYFSDENNGFIGGSGCFQGELIDRLTNGTWSATTISTTTFNTSDRITDIDFNGSIGLASSLGGRFLRSTNGGASWDTIASPYGNTVPVLSVAFVDDTLCYAGYDAADGGGFGLMRSTDAGLTWDTEFGMATFYYPDYYGIHKANGGKVYAGGKSYLVESGLVFTRTVDGNWGYDDVDHPVYDFSSYGDSVVFGVGDSGYVITNVPPGQLAIPNASEESVALIAFPNPVTDVVQLQTATAVAGSPFTVHSSDGRLVKQGVLSPAATIDCRDLQPGSYMVVVGQAVVRMIRE